MKKVLNDINKYKSPILDLEIYTIKSKIYLNYDFPNSKIKTFNDIIKYLIYASEEISELIIKPIIALKNKIVKNKYSKSKMSFAAKFKIK